MLLHFMLKMKDVPLRCIIMHSALPKPRNRAKLLQEMMGPTGKPSFRQRNGWEQVVEKPVESVHKSVNIHGIDRPHACAAVENRDEFTTFSYFLQKEVMGEGNYPASVCGKGLFSGSLLRQDLGGEGGDLVSSALLGAVVQVLGIQPALQAAADRNAIADQAAGAFLSGAAPENAG